MAREITAQDSPVGVHYTRLHVGVGGVSHLNRVNGSLDMKNQRGARPP